MPSICHFLMSFVVTVLCLLYLSMDHFQNNVGKIYSHAVIDKILSFITIDELQEAKEVV